MGIAEVSPSILAADFSRLAQEIALVEKAGARRLHLDVMDGHFVPNISFGPPVIRSLRPVTNLELWAHLMIEDPGRYLEDYHNTGVEGIVVHLEIEADPFVLAGSIRQMGNKAGLAINPGTDVLPVLDKLELFQHILIMSVEPGFGGQKFRPETLDKVKIIKKRFPGLTVAIDGGIDRSNAPAAVRAGVDILIAGSAVFRETDPSAAFRELTEAANQQDSMGESG